MKHLLAVLLCASFFGVAQAQETTVRIVGAYPSHISQSPARMTQHLQAIATAWNSSGLPGASATTVTLLNGAVALPVSYPGLPPTVDGTAAQAYSVQAIRSLRAAWQADVVVLFTDHSPCGATRTGFLNGNFQPDAQGLDLRDRHENYVNVVVSACPSWVAAHEFGHLGGGGHVSTGPSLYSDSRAYIIAVEVNPQFPLNVIVRGTALADDADLGGGSGFMLNNELTYSRNELGFGAPEMNNRRALAMTARSLANYYEYPSNPPVLYPPINLIGYNLGCVNAVETRHDLYWQDDPATTANVTSYEVWKSQPVGQPFVYGWTVYAPFSQSFVSGAVARARVNACSGTTCSALSSSFYDAGLSCNW